MIKSKDSITLNLEKSLLLVFLFFTYSCSLLRYDNPLEFESNNKIQDSMCENEKITLTMSDRINQTTFLELIMLYKDQGTHAMGFIGGLFFLMANPHRISPQTPTYLFFLKNNTPHFYRFPSTLNTSNTSSSKSVPHYFLALQTVLQSGQININNLLKKIPTHHTNMIRVNSEFYHFLISNQKALEQNSSDYKRLIRGNQILKEGEHFTIPSVIPYIKSITKMKIKKNNEEFFFNFPNEKKSNSDFQNPKVVCNTDLSLYQHNLFPISKNNSNLNYLIIKHNSDVIAIFTGQNHSLETNPIDTHFFQPIGLDEKIGHCKKTLSDNENEFYFSLEGRDPSQFLYYIMNETPFHKKTTSSFSFDKPMISLIQKARKITLTSPMRIIAETELMNKDEINSMLYGKYPHYHIEKMGNIIGIKQMTDGKVSVYNDSRYPRTTTCKQQ